MSEFYTDMGVWKTDRSKLYADWYALHKKWEIAMQTDVFLSHSSEPFAAKIKAMCVEEMSKWEEKVNAAREKIVAHDLLKPKYRKPLSKKIRLSVLSKSGGSCHYCKRQIPIDLLQVDHVVPVFSGGTDHESNLVASCSSCNGSKGKKSYEQFTA